MLLYYILASVQEEEDFQEATEVFCENPKCESKKSFWPNTILKHIGGSKKCKAFYGPRFTEMKKQQNREKMQKSRKKKGIKRELKSQRDSYAKNPAKRKRK